MVKNEALSSDLRFIKEVEELKIKQKLLIESLKRKSSDEQNKLFLEINSKLDFLVNIFNEANKSGEEAPNTDEHSQFTPIFEKIDELAENIDKRFLEIESKLTIVKPPKENDEEMSNSENENKNVEPSPPNLKEGKSELRAPPVEDVPAPDFKSEINPEGTETEPKKKKKWF